MRMEELANNNFVKGTDSVERYLLSIIKQYFSSNSIDEDSREYIINKAVERMKEELFIDNAGVISINGKTGEVNITLKDLDGEPAITYKESAFNVPFGNVANTACEGNDYRLYDERQPLPHHHDISEIVGLSNELSTIQNNISLLGLKTHAHNNLDILDMLTYSGTNSQIDLTILDTVEDKVNLKITEANNVISDTESKINNLITQVTNELNQYNADYSNIKTYIDSKDSELETSIKQYCNTTLENKINEVDAALADTVSNKSIDNIISALNQQFSVVYENSITGFIESDDSTLEYEYSLPDDIVTVLSTLNDKEYNISFCIKYDDPESSKKLLTNCPFIYADNGKILYTIKIDLADKSIIKVTSTKKDSIDLWPAFIKSAILKIKISVKNNILLEV